MATDDGRHCQPQTWTFAVVPWSNWKVSTRLRCRVEWRMLLLTKSIYPIRGSTLASPWIGVADTSVGSSPGSHSSTHNGRICALAGLVGLAGDSESTRRRTLSGVSTTLITPTRSIARCSHAQTSPGYHFAGQFICLFTVAIIKPISKT